MHVESGLMRILGYSDTHLAADRHPLPRRGRGSARLRDGVRANGSDGHHGSFSSSPLRRAIWILTIALACLMALGGCAKPAPIPTVAPTAAATAPAPTALPPTMAPPTVAQVTALPPTPAPTTPKPQPTPKPASTVATVQPALPPEPRPVAIRTADGRELGGVYYPAASAPAPVVVLMHWAPGDISVWNAIAPWLQNRGVAGVAWPGGGNAPKWRDPAWFPKLDAARSYAVLAFSFTGCGESGCTKFVPDQWLLDAQAAMQTAYTLEGGDPTRIVAVGASIGADGAADGCLWLNEQHPGACRGAMSLSPGSYLKVPYEQAAAKLGSAQPPAAAWCLYATGDAESQRACSAAEGAKAATLRVVKYDGDAHGMMLIAPTRAPEVLGLLLEFLQATLGS